MGFPQKIILEWVTGGCDRSSAAAATWHSRGEGITPHTRSGGQRPREGQAVTTGTAGEGATASQESGETARRSYPATKVRAAA